MDGKPSQFAVSGLLYVTLGLMLRVAGQMQWLENEVVDLPTLWIAALVFGLGAVAFEMRPDAARSKRDERGRAKMVFWILHVGVCLQAATLPGETYVWDVFAAGGALMLLAAAAAALYSMLRPLPGTPGKS